MNRSVGVVLLFALVLFGASGCKKAHDAGNDSMSVGGGKMEVSASAADATSPAKPRD
jgi:hypothetical protein